VGVTYFPTKLAYLECINVNSFRKKKQINTFKPSITVRILIQRDDAFFGVNSVAGRGDRRLSF